MSLKVFYTSIYGFVPYQLSRPSIQATFRLTHKKHETSKRTAQSHRKRHYQPSLETTLSKIISFANKLRRSNLNAVNSQGCHASSNLLKFEISPQVSFNLLKICRFSKKPLQILNSKNRRLNFGNLTVKSYQQLKCKRSKASGLYPEAF